MYITDIELDTYYRYAPHDRFLLKNPPADGLMVVKAVGTTTKAPNFEDSTVQVEIVIEGKRNHFSVKPHELLSLGDSQ